MHLTAKLSDEVVPVAKTVPGRGLPRVHQGRMLSRMGTKGGEIMHGRAMWNILSLCV